MNVRDRIVDAGLVVVSTSLLWFWAVRVADSWGGGYWQLGCAAGAVVCGIAVIRRRHLTGTAAAGLLVAALTMVIAWLTARPAEPGPAMALGLAVLVGSAVRVLRPIPATAIAAAGLVIAVGSMVFQRSAGVPAVTALNLAGWIGAVVVGVGWRVRDDRRRAITEKVRLDERLELARELHDVVAHHITGIVLQAQAARIIRRKNPDELDDSLTGIEAAGSEALAAMRRVVGLLRDTEDAAPATAGLEQLDELVNRFRGHGPQVRLRVPPERGDLPPETTSTVYRIVQESLTNIARHAPTARSVTVAIARDERTVSVEVTDDGQSRQHHRGGYGLLGIRERVEALDGSLAVGPRTDGGWTVRATLPLTGGDLAKGGRR